MTEIAKVIELVGTSQKSWEDAAESALARACETCRNVRGIDVVSQTAEVENDEITEYRTTVKVSFGVEPKD